MEEMTATENRNLWALLIQFYACFKKGPIK